MGERFCTIFVLVLAAVGTRLFGVHAETAEELNEGDEKTITCPRSLVQRLNITSARYMNGTCESPGTLQTLQASCGGRPSCYVRAVDDVFGDYCQGQSRLEFSYECLNLPGYHGCFGDSWWPNRALSGDNWDSNSLTIQACLKGCRDDNYMYAGVEYGRECFCGHNDNFGRHGEKPMSQCNYLCNGDNEQNCGGRLRIEVYESSMGNYGAEQTLDGDRYYVYSPDFPGLYPRSKTCQWTIRTGDDKVIKLYLDLFNLTSGDVIKVRDGTEDSQDLGPGLTGTTIPSVPASSGSAIWVQFQSDSDRDTLGRFIFWTQEIGHCGPIPLPPDSGIVQTPYRGNVGVGETALVICNNGRRVWVRCDEDLQFNHTGPYCQDETTAISSTMSSTRISHHSFPTQEGLSTSSDGLNPPNNASGQEGEGTRSTVTFIAVGVAVPLVVIATVAAAIVLCRRKRNATSKSPGSGQASQPDFASSRASASPSGSVGLSSDGARYMNVAHGGTNDPPSEHLYAVPDDDMYRAKKAGKPRRADQAKNRSPVPPVHPSQDEGFTENDLYETAHDVTARHGPTETEAEGSVENVLYGQID